MSKRNKKITFAAAALTTGTLLAVFSMSAYGAQITEDDAKEIAFEDAGITEDETLSVRVNTEREDGRQLLEVGFVTQDYREYEYEILAENGLIYGASCECGNAAGEGRETTLEQAQQLAAEHAGELTDEVVFTKAETERDDGRRIHELEFRTQDEKEFDYEIDADTGEILSWDYDGKGHLAWMEKNQTQDGSENPLLPTEDGPVSGLEAAKDAALKKAGLSDEDVTWGRVYEDFDDGRMVYEGKFLHETDEYEFEADAATGEITDWEVESIFD